MKIYISCIFLIVSGLCHSQSISEQFGVTSYLQYGGGEGLYNPTKPGDFEPRLFELTWHRHFSDFRRYHQGDPNASGPNGSNIFQPQRTPQGWHTDDYLRLLQINGVKAIWCIQGRAGFQNTIGSAGKVMPISEEDSPYELESWAELAHHAQQIAIRYAADTGPYQDKAEHYTQPGDWRTDPKKNTGVSGVGQPLAGLGLLESIQILNEPNFRKSWSGASRDIDAKGAATAFYAAYKAVREVSKINMVTPPPIGGDLVFLGEFSSELELLNGGPLENVTLAFHWYMRERSLNQGDGPDKGASPEFVRAARFGVSMDSLVKKYGFEGWSCTETGWSALPTVDKSKQSCPIQEGFTQEESQGLLYVRLALIWGAMEHYRYTTFWHCADNYDSGGYQYGGLCYRQTPNRKDWDKKPGLIYIESFLSTYGHMDVVAHGQEEEGFFSILQDTVKASGLPVYHVVSWVDGKKIGGLTGEPVLTRSFVIPVDPQMHCKNGVMDFDEQGIDCGGSCVACVVIPPVLSGKQFRIDEIAIPGYGTIVLPAPITLIQKP